MDRLRSLSKISQVYAIKPTINILIGAFGFGLIFIYIILNLYYLPSSVGCYNTNKHISFFLHGTFALFMIIALYILFVDKFKTPNLSYLLIFLFGLSLFMSFFLFVKCFKSNDNVNNYLTNYNFIQSLILHYKKKTHN